MNERLIGFYLAGEMVDAVVYGGHNSGTYGQAFQVQQVVAVVKFRRAGARPKLAAATIKHPIAVRMASPI
jgi:hypothetical protein